MVSIIIPVYNEQDRIELGIREIVDYLKKSKLKAEIVVVNDGSRDRTGDILIKLKKEFGLKVVELKKNSGKGAAIRAGVDVAQGELILFTDIDLSVPIDFLKKYLEVLTDDVDIIIGTRAIPGAKVEVKQFWLRELMGEMFTFLSNLILGVGVSDFTCGFKLFRKEAARMIFNRQQIKRWAFDAESLYIAQKFNFKIKEVAVVWRHREGSKVKFPRDLIETLISLFKIRINDLQGRYT